MTLKIGVSACLLGERLRYDGGHKLDGYISNFLGAHVTLVPVCPEVECGMPVPREPMSLEGDPVHPRLVTNLTRVDKTEPMLQFCRSSVVRLQNEELSGFIFKRNSPSCGLQVRVTCAEGTVSGRGLFAVALCDALPHLPVEEEEGLKELSRRENFVERVFAYRRWRNFCQRVPDPGSLVDFHSREKLVVMAHSTSLYREIGSLVSRGSTMPLPVLLQRYEELFMAALRKPATVKGHTNVLQHAMGYFKKDLVAREKEELLCAIKQYHDNLLPLIVPLTLLRHYLKRYPQPYLERQAYLFPDPVEILLRNHP